MTEHVLMSTPERGEVWIADLGWSAKTRPVLILNFAYSDFDYALYATIATLEFGKFESRYISRPLHVDILAL